MAHINNIINTALIVRLIEVDKDGCLAKHLLEIMTERLEIGEEAVEYGLKNGKVMFCHHKFDDWEMRNWLQWEEIDWNKI